VLRYPYITGHALCVIAAAVGIAGSFHGHTGAGACAAAAGIAGFVLLVCPHRHS
jgi:hypothetical protein